MNNCRGVLSTTATLLSLRDISPDRGITRVSARRTGTNHLIFDVLLCVEFYVRLSRIKRIVWLTRFTFPGRTHGSAPTNVTERLALSETSAPSVISQSEMTPFSGENGNLSTSATLLGFAHFPYEEITFCRYATFHLFIPNAFSSQPSSSIKSNVSNFITSFKS